MYTSYTNAGIGSSPVRAPDRVSVESRFQFLDVLV